jgi:diguanylate cyclase (GGDEF)-like protein
LANWWVTVQRRVDVPGITLLTVTVFTIGTFKLSHNSAIVCSLLMVPIALLAYVRGWVAGLLAALSVAVCIAPYVRYIAPYYEIKDSLINPPLTLDLWILVTLAYVALGVSVGIRGNLVRRAQRDLMADYEAKLEHAKASAEHYEALLEQMSLGQEHLMRMNEELALLNGIATAVNSSLDMAQIIDSAVSNLRALLRIDALGVYWLAPEGDALTLEAVRPDIPAPEDARRQPVHLGDDLLSRVLHGAGPVLDCQEDGALVRLPVFDAEVHSLIAVPLRLRARPLGVLVLGRHAAEPFTTDDAKFLESLARILTLAIENAKLFERAQELSLSDELTGLNNRRMFNLRLQAEVTRAKAAGDPLCLVIFDLDFFKRVNDQYGHQAGDEVLKTFARILQHDIRGADLVCRIGGEEFSLLVPDTVLLEAYAIAQRICRHVAATPFTLEEGVHITMTVSAGVACLDGTIAHGDALVGAADRALYAAKAAGRNRVEVYTSAMGDPLPAEVAEPAPV